MRRADSQWLSAPGQRRTGTTCVSNFESAAIPINGGQPLPSTVHAACETSDGTDEPSSEAEVAEGANASRLEGMPICGGAILLERRTLGRDEHEAIAQRKSACRGACAFRVISSGRDGDIFDRFFMSASFRRSAAYSRSIGYGE